MEFDGHRRERREYLSSSQPDAAWSSVTIVYILYLAGFLVPLVAVAGLVVSYAVGGSSGTEAQTHLRMQRATFWRGFAMNVVMFCLILLGVGFAVVDPQDGGAAMIACWIAAGALYLWWFAWTLGRCMSGILLARECEPIDELGVLGIVAK